MRSCKDGDVLEVLHSQHIDQFGRTVVSDCETYLRDELRIDLAIRTSAPAYCQRNVRYASSSGGHPWFDTHFRWVPRKVRISGQLDGRA